MESKARKVLKLEDVTKTFPGVKALDHVSFDVAAGEVHGLVGENGAGKSTLMAVASGAQVADEGTVTIDGTIVDGGPKQTRELGLAIVRQEPSLMPDLTVAENMFLGVPLSRRPEISNLNQWADGLLAAWDKREAIRPHDLVAALNPEKRFIVEIAKALAANPKVLILDEPTEHLLSEDVERLFARVREVAAAGTAVVYISHRIREVRRVARRITVLRDGSSQGTFETASVDEKRIVELIVGGTLDHEHPPKGVGIEDRPVVLDAIDLSGAGFRNVSLSIRAGEVVGLAGIDGNGQREFLRALAGLNPIGEGRLALGGQAVRLRGPDAAAANGIGYLPGDRHRESIFAELTVEENFAIRSIAQDAHIGFISRASEARRASAAVTAFAVKTPTLDTPISSLSGGNQQKLVLASVLAGRPRVLLVDEPTQGVDVGARSEIYRILRKIAAEGTAIIVVSSDAAEIAGLCDRVAVFSRGEIKEVLAGDAVTENNITTTVLTCAAVRSQARKHVGAFWEWAAGNSAPIVLVGLAVILLGIYASYVSEFYLTARNLGGVFGLVATLALVSYGQQIIMLIGEIDLSVGPLMGLCVVIGSYFLGSKMGGGSFLAGFVLIFAAAIAVGVVNFLLVDKISIHPMIATLATFMGVQAISLVLRPSPAGLIDTKLMKLIGTKIGFVPVTLIVTVVIGIVLEYVLFRTTVGIAVRGLGSKPEAARVVGISPRAVRFWAYVACALFAALAAIPMLAQVGVGDAKAGINYTLASIAAVVIGGGSLAGGRGSFVGALLGALLLNQVNVVSTFLQLSDAWIFYLQGAMVLIGVAVYSRSRQMAVAA